MVRASLQVNDDHFRKATQNPTQLVAAEAREDSQEENMAASVDKALHEKASDCERPQKGKITPVGIRTPNLRFRRPMLYPIELQAQVFAKAK